MDAVAEEPLADERPMTPLETIIAQIWAAELGLPQVGLDVDFIDLGSHSLQGVAVAARLEARLGVAVPVRVLFEEPTVADLAAWLERRLPAPERPATLVRVHEGAGLRPVFAVPGGHADLPKLYGLARLARESDPRRSLYAFQGDPALTEPVPAGAWMAAAAAALVAEIRAVQARGPYLLLGVCIGGVMAWEITRQLEAAGESVELLLVDTFNPIHPKRRRPNTRGVVMLSRSNDQSLAPRGRKRRGGAFDVREISLKQPLPEPSLGAMRVVMAKSYRPAPLAARVTLLANKEWRQIDPTLGWGPLCTGLTVKTIGDEHGLHWNLPEVAALFRDWLDSADPDAEAAAETRPHSSALPAQTPLVRERDANQTAAADSDEPETIIDALQRRATRSPEAQALLAPDWGALDSRGLADAVERLAANLGALGIGREDQVALVLPDGPALAVALLAAMTAGVAGPLAWDMSQDEYARALMPTKAVLLPANLPTAARAAAAETGIPVFELHGARPDGNEPFRIDGAELAPVVPRSPQPDDVALMIFSSGTTGCPKRIPRTHHSITATTRAVIAAMATSPDDRCLNLAPMAFSQGANALFTSVWAGASIVTLPGVHLPAVPAWVRTFRPTWFSATPTVLRALVSDAAAVEALREAPLRMVRASAGALSRAEIDRLEATLGVPVLHSYGMSEASFIAGECFGAYERKSESVGVVQCEVAIVDADDRLLPAGASGEIVVRGPNVFAGYPDDPTTNAAAFLPGGWFRTGDVGRLDADGYLYVTGRIKELIKRGGLAISPLEVEDALLADPAVAAACVFGVPHADLGEDVMAAVVVRPGALTTERGLRQRVASTLSPHKVPRAIAFVTNIPQGPTGKPLRRELAAAMAPLLQPAAADEQVEKHGPVAALARTLIGVWSGILGQGPIAIDDDLFDLGADSLQVARMVAAAQEALGVEVGPSVLFEQRTPARIAAWAAAQAASADASTAAQTQTRLDQPVFVVVSGIERHPLPVARLGPVVDSRRSFHELAVPVRSKRVDAGSRVERIALASLETVRAAQPYGPYSLVGTGAAGAVAVAMARQLEGAGEEVRLLLVDARNPALRAPQSERNEREARCTARTARRNTKTRERRGQEDRVSSGLVTLIATADALTENATLGWGDLLGDRLRVLPIGPHARRRELLLAVVRALREWLRESDPA